MNKKILFLATGVMMASASFAQKAKLKEATKELENATSAKDKPADAAAAYQKAKAAIDAAATDPETKDNPKTWVTKAGIYIGMQENPSLNADHPYREGLAALKKAISLDKKLESDATVANLLANVGFFAYNDGINTYNNSRYGEAYNQFKEGMEALGPDKDKRFVMMPVIDTIRAQSQMFMGYTAFYDKNYDEAITNLTAVKGSPYLQKESNVYLILSQAYEQKGNKEQQLAILQEGKQKFPGDKNIENSELNYYISSGKQNEVTGKLEEAAAKEPGNPDLQLNLGIIYAGLARPLNGAAPPANAKEYLDKAEAAYKKAVSLAPDNGTYNYQLGAFYFNQAADLNTNMNNLGTGKEDQKKYNEMLKQRDALFAQSLPGLEKSKDAFGTRKFNLKPEEGRFYMNTLSALKEIYNRTEQTEKVAEIKKLITEVSQKQ